jgi:glycosyltransferase involved in cell wall biosynthesis
MSHHHFMISVILSTYNQPLWLEKVLWGYSCQSDSHFEIVIADDGSGEETKRVIDSMREQTNLVIQHVWQAHEGFGKSRILNKATLAASGEYLIFSDGDCIPRADFISVHRRFAQPGRYLSGGYTKLPQLLSQQLTKEDILAGRVFSSSWLAAQGFASKTWHKHAAGRWAWFWNLVSPTKATWNGHGSSTWKQDILRVNGHNEEMRYGGQDREMGERLENLGLKGKRIRYYAIVMHLDHPRGYATPESIAKNKEIRRHTRQNQITWTPEGIDQHHHDSTSAEASS